MKALIISDNDEVLAKVDEVFQQNNIDTIVYHWLLKALDNLVEISPDLILISAFDYPRHWKTMVQFLKSEICRKYPVVILYRPADIPHEELKKEEILKIDGFFSSIDEEGLSKLDSLLKKIKSDCSEYFENIHSEENTVLCEENLSSIPTVDELMAEDSESDCEIPTVNQILAEDSENDCEIPSVNNLLAEDFENDCIIPSVDELIASLSENNSGLTDVALPTVDSLFAQFADSNVELPTVDNLLNFIDEEADCNLPTVSSLLSENSMEIPSVNNIAEKPETAENQDMEEDSELPTVSNLIGDENVKLTSGHFGTISDFLDSIEIPSVDTLFTQIDNVDIPTVDEISEKLNECLTASYESAQSIPTVDNLLADSQDFENSTIPSVDFIIKTNEEKKLRHSLLAHIQELYGEK